MNAFSCPNRIYSLIILNIDRWRYTEKLMIVNFIGYKTLLSYSIGERNVEVVRRERTREREIIDRYLLNSCVLHIMLRNELNLEQKVNLI